MDSSLISRARTPLMLSLLMLLMTQAGYLDDMNAWSEDEQALDATTPLQSGSGPSQSDLTPSVEGADLIIDESMSNITFEYDTGQTSTSNLFIANPAWTAADIATSADGAESVYVADMDGDGDLDIVSASRLDDTIAWYENDGAANPSWTAADIATSAGGAYDIHVADMDNDGDIDIVSAGLNDDTIAWYENDGAANPSWTAADIATSADGAMSVFVADMDGDGDLDIVSASYDDHTIAWYENDGAADPSWTAADIATSALGAASVFVADMDGDGDLDIVSASFYDDTIAWYENDGAANPSWAAADIDTNADGATSVHVADMDGDGDLDIVSSSFGDDTIAWYENDGAADPSWTAADIATSADGANWVYVADMDGDGDLDIVSASERDDTIAWYENDGAANPSWTAADIATSADGATSVHVADMDGDGDLDIVSSSYFDDTIAWYEETGTGTWTNTTGLSQPANAICSISPSLPAGLSMDSSTCTISGTPTVETSNTTYTVTAVISNVTYQGSVWLSTSTFGTITSAVEGAALNLGEAMTPITLNYTSQAGEGTVHNGNGTAWMVKDIVAGSSHSHPEDLVGIGSTLFFSAKVGQSRDLWRSDGTAAGTVMVKDIDCCEYMTPVGDTLYFVAGGANDKEIWKSDGTADGTVQVTNVTGEWKVPKSLTVVGDTIFFAADDGIHGEELWKTDGTTNGTVMVKDVYNGSDDGVFAGAIYQEAGFPVVGDTIFFVGEDETYGRELWRSDGTANGTVIVKDIDTSSNTYSSSSGSWTVPNSGLACSPWETAVGDTVYFRADDGTNGLELWKTDGTADGTVMLTNLYGNYSWSSNCGSSDVYNKARVHGALGDTVFFTGQSVAGGGKQLWSTDGTTAGTVQLTQECGSVYCEFVPNGVFGDLGGIFLFQGCSADSGCALWRSDGTAAGTMMVKDLDTETYTSSYWSYSDIYHPTIFGNLGFFAGKEASIAPDGTVKTSWDLWQTDGTTNGTVALSAFGSCHSIYPGCHRPEDLIGVGSNLYFGQAIGYPGDELWAFDPANISLDTPPPVSWETDPALPAGMTVSKGVIGGTPSVYVLNQTYTIRASQSGYTTTTELYFSVDTDNPHTVVENLTIDPIGFHPPFTNGTTTWTVSPSLPVDLSIDPATGRITGSVNGTMATTTYTVTATHDGGATEAFSFDLRSLADHDGDGLPDDLPGDYDAAEGPTPGLVADGDDDGDGLADSAETGSGNYVDGTDTGTSPLNPDTDGDGICDGPHEVPGACVNGPDADPNGAVPPPTLVGVNNTAIPTLQPHLAFPGATYEISPDLPASLVLDASNGRVSGVPTETLAKTTFTVWANRTGGPSLSWDFTVEVLEDSDGDGLPDQLPGDYDPSNPASPGLVEDPDDDGDGTCDGPTAVSGICTAGPDAFPLDPSADTDTDGDGMPDAINGDSTSIPPLVEDQDDDGDGLDDAIETNTGLYVGGSDTGTDPLNPDTDFDGVCDGPNSVPPICEAGPDGNPLGQPAEGSIYGLRNSRMESIQPEGAAEGATYEVQPDLPPGVRLSAIGVIYGTPTEVFGRTSFTVWANQTDGTSVESVFWIEVLEDTDGDGLPDELPDDYDASQGDLVEDEDDDNDGVTDLDEGASGTDPADPDGDGDGICDGPISFPPTCLAGPDSNPFGIQHPSPLLLVNNSKVASPIPPPNHVPDATWEVSPDLPTGMALDPATGMISGTPAQAMANTTYTIWANQSGGTSIEATFWLEVLEDTDGDGMPDEMPDDYDASQGDLVEDQDDDNDGSSDLDEVARGTDPRDPDTDGDGVCDGPTAPADGGCTAQVDANSLQDAGSGYLWMLCCVLLLLLLLLLLPLLRRDRASEAVLVGPEPENTRADPKFIGGAGTKEDPFILAPVEGLRPGQAVSSKESITIDGMSMIDMVLTDLGQGANGDRFGMREADAQEGATRVLPIDYGEATINMVFDDGVGGPTKEGGEFTGLLRLGRASVYLSWTVRVQPDEGRSVGAPRKGATTKGATTKGAAKDAEKKAKAEAAEKAKEEAAAAAAAEKAAKEAKAAEEKAAKEAERKPKPASKEAKKQEELKRVKSRAKSIDFKVLGEANSSKLRTDVKKGATSLEVADASEFADAGSAALTDKDGTTVISWTGKDGNALTGVSGITRVFGKASIVTTKDDLQVLKGVGPFIEDKLNALGITTYRQIANMNAKLEEQVNKAIEFFPGRIKRDQWANQAKILLGEDVKLDEKALKQAEELERIAKKAENIDFATLGVASASEKDDLKSIKGIGPFIEEKLNALGIFTFDQVSKMTPKIEEEVNEAIEFFPGRVRRDEWARQAGELARD